MHVYSVELLESHAPSLSLRYARVIGGRVPPPLLNSRILSAFMLAQPSHAAYSHAKICGKQSLCVFLEAFLVSHLQEKRMDTEKQIV